MTTGGLDARLIDDRFELLQRLGGGGMGLVWRARDNALHREVALKEVRPADPAMAAADPAQTRETRERVLREARSLARLQHPNVVIIHHIVDSPEHPHPWLVMELVSGGSLADRLAQGPLTVAEAARIGRGVLGALRAAHAVGIQHRDVKPGNVLLRADGTPVLTDFGIAAMSGATALTSTGALIGSPEFMAPERIRGEEGNPSSDLWSLGMMLYVAVEGRHPLRRANVISTLAAVLDEPLPPPVRSGPLGPLLGALLAKDPRTRPDAAQLDQALAQVEYEAGHETRYEAQYGASPVPADSPTWVPTPPGTPTVSPVTAPVLDLAPISPKQPARGGPRRTTLITVAVALTAVAGILGWSLRPGTGTGTGLPTTAATAPHLAPALPAASHPAAAAGAATAPSSAAGDPSTPSAPTGGLITPAGVRATIAAMSPTMGGTKVIRLVIYPEYASATFPTAANPELYDSVDYRDGSVTRSVGGTVTDVDKVIDLRGFDWDALPALLQKAQDTLKVPKPNSPYLIIEADMFTGVPGISVYLSNDYGSGYLEADAKGNVTRSYPLGS
ncbi:serine/threonine-protein kinase [Kitasatospora sp. MAP5-34]|uniref:serine/threonine-protein kinase n=1 Tax=Kitasatospora sp. MAP5-34 TaxID=3035102 RepID=UPI002475D161|nr:serine/threonine-protein kinase [Kitasatospora sp. MAP5-34]